MVLVTNGVLTGGVRLEGELHFSPNFSLQVWNLNVLPEIKFATENSQFATILGQD